MQLTKNFHLSEFHCKDGTQVPFNLACNVLNLAAALQIIRDTIKQPLHINSAYRTPEHNKKVKGAKNSYHLKAMAADITCKTLTPAKLLIQIEMLINKKQIPQGGLFLYPGFVHYDIRGFKAR